MPPKVTAPAPLSLADSIAANCSSAPEFAGTPLSFGPIIQDLFTMLEQWLTGCGLPASATTAQQQVTEAYHPDSDTYERNTMTVATRKARNAAHRNGTPIEKNQAEVLAKQTLDGIRTGTQADVAAAMGVSA